MKKARKPAREPSKRSLREMPEADFSSGARPNRFASRIARGGPVVQVGGGRPRKVAEAGLTTPRSIRFPRRIWKLLNQRARKKGLTMHAAMRLAIIEWMRNAA